MPYIVLKCSGIAKLPTSKANGRISSSQCVQAHKMAKSFKYLEACVNAKA